MTDDLNRLRAVAEAATPGPWRRVEVSATRSDVRGMPENTSYDARGDAIATAADSEFGACPDADADFIATFDPPTVLALLDRAERAETERDEFDQQAVAEHRRAEGWRGEAQRNLRLSLDYMAERDAAAADLAALRAAVEALADKWDEDHEGSDDCETCWLIQDLRSLLAAAPTETEGENT